MCEVLPQLFSHRQNECPWTLAPDTFECQQNVRKGLCKSIQCLNGQVRPQIALNRLRNNRSIIDGTELPITSSGVVIPENYYDWNEADKELIRGNEERHRKDMRDWKEESRLEEERIKNFFDIGTKPLLKP